MARPATAQAVTVMVTVTVRPNATVRSLTKKPAIAPKTERIAVVRRTHASAALTKNIFLLGR